MYRCSAARMSKYASVVGKVGKACGEQMKGTLGKRLSCQKRGISPPGGTLTFAAWL